MRNRTLFSRIALVAVALGFGLLTGCHRDFIDRSKLQSTVESHHADFNDAEKLQLNTGTITPTAAPASDPNTQVYTDETGHRVPKSYYILYCDIYWKLNWFRQQLRRGDIPEHFTRKLAAVRKELREATTGIAHDGNYRVADEALTFLETGWGHYQAGEDLAAAGAQIASAPWSAGTIAMQQFIESGGMGFGSKSLANSPITPAASVGQNTSLGSSEPGSVDIGTAGPLTPRQERAIAVAMHYAGEFHRPPRQCAQEDWSRAVEKINKLRDQLWMMNKANNRDSGSLVDVRPEIGTQLSSGDDEHTSNAYTKGGTDLPTASAPIGDPFLTPPATPSTTTKSAHDDE